MARTAAIEKLREGPRLVAGNIVAGNISLFSATGPGSNRFATLRYPSPGKWKAPHFLLLIDGKSAAYRNNQCPSLPYDLLSLMYD